MTRNLLEVPSPRCLLIWFSNVSEKQFCGIVFLRTCSTGIDRNNIVEQNGLSSTIRVLEIENNPPDRTSKADVIRRRDWVVSVITRCRVIRQERVILIGFDEHASTRVAFTRTLRFEIETIQSRSLLLHIFFFFLQLTFKYISMKHEKYKIMCFFLYNKNKIR